MTARKKTSPSIIFSIEVAMCQGTYSPKIKEEFIPLIYEIAKEQKMPMTKVVNAIIEKYLNESQKGQVLEFKGG